MSTTNKRLSFRQALGYLAEFTNYERVTDYKCGPATLGTERIGQLLELLDNPQTCAPAIHIAGTKGKGSTAYLSARLLMALGYKVGLFASPHVYSIRERAQINCEPVSEDCFTAAFNEVLPAVEKMKSHSKFKPPTYFEILTAIAFVAFRNAGVGVMVVEVGLGGRLDATNVQGMPVAVSGICNISFDHTKQLGNDLLSIAGEKAGILKEGVPVVFAPQEKSVMEFLQGRAWELSCRAVTVGGEIDACLREDAAVGAPEAPQRLDLRTWRARHVDVALTMIGDCQRVNAAMALGIVELFLEGRGPGAVDTASIRRAWRDAALPGRFQIVSRDPWMVLDGAHNPASFWALGDTLHKRFPGRKICLVLSIAKDKDIPAMLKILLPMVGSVVLTKIPTGRCMDVEEVAQVAREGYECGIEIEPDIAKALDIARENAGDAGVVCVTGSIYLVGEAGKVLGESKFC